MLALPDPFMAWTAGVILTLATCALGIVLLRTPRQYDPQRGQAIGCLLIVLAGLLMLAGLLAVAVLADIRWLLVVVFDVTAFPLVWVLLGLVYNLARWVQKKVRGA